MGCSPARAPQQEPAGTEMVLSAMFQHPTPSAAPATGIHHSPRAATASFRTSLFLSSKGLASARITLALYGSSCRTDKTFTESWALAAPQEDVWDLLGPSTCRSTYHGCGQAGERVGTAQGSDADSLEQTGVRAAGGAGAKERGGGERRSRTYHGGARGEAEELGDQCVDVQAHDLGSFE